MDHFIELLRHFAAVVAAIAAIATPIIKLFNERRTDRPKGLEGRYRHLKAFVEDGGVDRHPVLVESGFAAAVGHARFTAMEVALILRQRKPLQFMDVYLRSRSYVQPANDGLQFRLLGAAKHPRARRALVILATALYVVLVAPGMGLLLFKLPLALLSEDWRASAQVATTGLLCTGTGFVILYLASQLHWAALIVEKQTPVMAPATGPAAA